MEKLSIRKSHYS